MQMDGARDRGRSILGKTNGRTAARLAQECARGQFPENRVVCCYLSGWKWGGAVAAITFCVQREV